MPSISSIYPLSHKTPSSLQGDKARQAFRPSVKKADSVRFGNPEVAEEKIPGRGKLALKNAFSWQGLKSDAIWGIALSIVSAIIPPHAHALMMFPASFAIGMTVRATSALFSPAGVHKTLQETAKEASKKASSK